MKTEKRRVASLLAIAFAVALLAAAPTQLRADEISVQGSGYFTEADTVYLSLTVNPDGSVTPDPIGNQPASGGWSIDSGEGCGPEICNSGVEFQALPPGSTITSGTFSYDITSTIDVNGFQFFNGAGTVTPPYSVSFSTSAGCSGGNGALQSASGSFSFIPCSAADQFYSVSFSGSDNLSPIIPNLDNFGPGDYGAAVNLGVLVNYTVTVDYVTTPEPRTYGPVAALGLMMIVALAGVRRASLRT